MEPFFRDRFPRKLIWCLAGMVILLCSSPAVADDCKRIQNILVLFDASGFMKERDRYHFFLHQMEFFKDAIPLAADGFFNVGIRHYGLKVGLGCDNTESILAIQPWDPERFINSFPPSVSYGISALSAGLRAAGDDVAGAEGKTIIVLIGGGIESCKGAPVNIAERLAFNNPDVEIHTFQIGNTDEGRFFLDGIARKCRGTYTAIDQSFSAASWHAWMKRYLVVPCAPPAPPAAAAPAAAIPPILFDHNSFSVRSKDPRVDAANLASLGAVGRLLQAKPSSRVVLHGFTDAKGAPDANLKISRRRAEAVARYLTANHRIPSARISIVPHGFAPGAGPQPAAPQIMEGRRVEIELVD